MMVDLCNQLLEVQEIVRPIIRANDSVHFQSYN